MLVHAYLATRRPLAIPAEEDAATGYAGKLAIGVAVHVLKR